MTILTGPLHLGYETTTSGSTNIDAPPWDKYRKKPVVIEAVQMPYAFDVETLEGVMHGNAGDWLIRGIKGEYYPCKPDVFEASYEKVTG